MNNKPSIVLGTWSWGMGFAGGDQVFGNKLEESELRPVFEEAMKNGLNTAFVYGMRASENILSKFIEEYPRSELFISTKFTPQIANTESDNPVSDMLESSLKRLGTDYIDMYWIHNPADVERWTPFIVPLVKSGKIRKIGISNHNLNQIKRVDEILSANNIHISAVQNHYSLLYRSSEEAGILDFCRNNGIDFWAYMVLEQGALSGKYDTKHPMPKDSQRGKTYNPLLPEIAKIVDVLRKVGDKYGVSPASIAIAWAIAKGTTPIIGVTKLLHVQNIIKLLRINLSLEDIQLIENAAKKTNVDTRGAWEMPMNL